MNVSLRKILAALWLGATAFGLSVPTARAYVLNGRRWESDQPIVINLQLGTPDRRLLDGAANWNLVAEAALDIWNPYLAGSGIQFQVDESVFTPAERDGRNSVFFSSTLYGEAFGSDTLATTVSYYNTRTNFRSESDVVFNSAKPFDSYRGGLRTYTAGRNLIDLRRVAIHEFGHVLGLDHTPQNSASIMTPYITDIDTIQPDDIAGVEAIYDGPGTVPIILGELSATAAGGKAFRYQISATGYPTLYQAFGLPAGLTIDPTTGLISGTVIGYTDDSYYVTLKVSNGAATGTATLLLTVNNVPVITSRLAATAQVGQPFTYQITASHQPLGFGAGYGTYDTALPGGLSLDKTTGILSGTPTNGGSYYLKLAAANRVGQGTALLVLKISLDSAVTTLHRFDSTEGKTPSALIQTADGNFYGTTRSGGTVDHGTVFKMAPDGHVTTLCSFGDADGEAPTGLTLAADGNFYGTTAQRGDNNFGTIFRVTPAGTLTTLHHFTELEGGASYPPTQGPDGNFYGSTHRVPAYFGNTLAEGEFYKATPDGTVTPLRPLANTGTVSRLIAGPDGNLYGTTTYGLNATYGTVFKLTPGGTMTTVHEFGYTESHFPSPDLILGQDGSFYGTTAGDSNGSGVFYRLAPDGAFTVLHTSAATETPLPTTLVQSRDGTFYGTSYAAQYVNFDMVSGTVVKLSAEGTPTRMHAFVTGEDGAGPSALIQAADGEFYGATVDGGAGGRGVLFRTTLILPPVVEAPPIPSAALAVTTAEATVGSGGMAVFTVSLSSPQSTDVLVHYTIRGSAVNGTDYVELSGTKKIKAGKTSRQIKIVPQGDLGGMAKKTVKLTLEVGEGYTVTDSPALKVKILAGQ